MSTGENQIGAKPKILYLITKSNWGGAQKYVFDLAKEAKSFGYDVVVATGGTGDIKAGPGKLVEELEKENIRVKFLPHITRDIFWWREALGFFDILKTITDEDPDIIHLNSSKAAGIGAFWSRMVGIKKIIYTVHGWPFNESKSLLTKTLRTFFSWLTALLATNIIVISQADMAQASQMPFVRKKTRLVYNGISPTSPLPRPEARLKLKSLSGVDIKQSELLVGTVAELHPNKGLDKLIRASALTNENWKTLIIGNGQEKDNLEKEIDSHQLKSKVFLAGFIPDASSLIRAFDIFVLPSNKEGLPYVILEAGIAGLPVIATNVGGVPEIIESEHSGIILKLNSPEELSVTIDSLIKNSAQREKFGANLNKKVRGKFSRVEMIEKTFATYSK